MNLQPISIPVTLTAEQAVVLDRLRVTTGESREEMATRLLAVRLNQFRRA